MAVLKADEHPFPQRGRRRPSESVASLARIPADLLAISFAVLLVAVPAALPWGSAQGSEIRALRHFPPAGVTPGHSLIVEATLIGDVAPEEISAADVIVVDVTELYFPLTLSHGTLTGEIPAELIAPPSLSYYLRVVDSDGIDVTAPPDADEGGVFRVEVTERTAGASGTAGAPSELLYGWGVHSVLPVSPLENEITDTATPQVAAMFEPPLTEPWDVLVTLDGEDVTGESVVTPELVLYEPAVPLARGAHRVTVSTLSPVGPAEAAWTFYVLEAGAAEPALPEEEVRPAGEWPAGAWPTGAGQATAFPDEDWFVSGRAEAGWAYVMAETTAVDSGDVFLLYPESNAPTIDLFLSGSKGDHSFLVTSRYDRTYSGDFDWLVNYRSGGLVLEAGQIFPSLSRTTLNWAVGHGMRAAAAYGRATTEVIGMRIAEADTLAGFGTYSRFAVAGRQSHDWTKHLTTTAVVMSVFDREGSIPEEQQLSDPLRNTVVAGLVSASGGRLSVEFELARSSAEGETEGSGSAVRAALELERDRRNRVSLEYFASEPDFYTAGSYEDEPGEHTLQLDCSIQPGDMLNLSGWLRAGRSFSDDSAIAEGEYEVKAYARVELTWPLEAGTARTYLVLRRDSTPYPTYEREYTYAALGGSWRRGATRASGSVGYSGTRSTEETETWSAYADLRRELVKDRWTVQVSSRWSSGSGGSTDYTRTRHAVETRWDFGDTDLGAEYWLVGREDRSDPLQTYTEHVFRISVGLDL